MRLRFKRLARLLFSLRRPAVRQPRLSAKQEGGRATRMLTQQTLERLRQLRLTGMADALARQMEQPATDELSFEERFGLLVDAETSWRETRRLQRLLRRAHLKQSACLEDIDYSHRRGLERRLMASLSSCDWIRAGQNLCITGPTGCGKTWLACGFGQQACRQGLSALYTRVPRLFDELQIARGDGSYRRRLGQLARLDLLILDDWGLRQMTRPQREDVLEMLEDRHPSRSTLITSQLPVDHWHEAIGEPTLADAILDRILHNAHKLALKGESMRKVRSQLTERERSR